MEQTCGGECGACLYLWVWGPSLQHQSQRNCPWERTSKKPFTRRLGHRVPGCGESVPPSVKKRQSPGECFRSVLEGRCSLIQRETSRSAQRTEVPEAGPCISPSLSDPCKDIQANSGTAQEEASSSSVFDMTECLHGLSFSRGLSSRSGPHVPLGRKLGPLPSTLPKGWAKLALSEVQKEQSDGF